MSGNNYRSICPSCHVENVMHGKAMTLALTCSSCHAYYRMGGWNKVVTKFANVEKPSLAIGSKGRFEGILYQVMGFVIKKELKHKYTWREYLLFNPSEGYVYLSEYDGHWNFIWPAETDPQGGAKKSTFTFETKTYNLFQSYQSEVIFAKGEFFFDIVDITATTFNREYIAPPFLFGTEKSDDSHLCYHGEYITREEVASAFQIPPSSLPSRSGVGYTQPFYGTISQKSLIKVSVILAATVVLLQLLLNAVSDDVEVVRGDFNPTEEKLLVTSTFDLPDNSQNLMLEFYKPLDNNWFAADFTLINESDGTEYNFTKEIEYYHGTEDGTSWSEGSQLGEAFLSRIPGGKYHINIYPEFGTVDKGFALTVKRDVAFYGNMWVTLLLLALFPAVYLFLRHHFEKRRWADSDYSPYDA